MVVTNEVGAGRRCTAGACFVHTVGRTWDRCASRGRSVPVPPFVDFWLPTLRYLSAGRTCRPTELVEAISADFRLSDAEQTERIPSGRTRVLDRVLWTITYLRQAG